MKTKLNLRKIVILVFWLGLWQLLAMIIDKPLIFVSATATFQRLISLIFTASFWLAIAKSLLFILLGLFLAYLLAFISGFISYRYSIIYELLQPLLTLFKSIPVASFAIMILIWFGQNCLALLVSFVVVYPQLYFAVVNGLNSTDNKMLQMAQVYHFNWKNKFLYIYRLAAAPYVLSASKTAISFAFKSSIAAELIANTTNTIGQQLYYSKIYLDTASLFSYTIVIVLVSYLTEKVLLALIKKAGGNYGADL